MSDSKHAIILSTSNSKIESEENQREKEKKNIQHNAKCKVGKHHGTSMNTKMVE